MPYKDVNLQRKAVRESVRRKRLAGTDASRTRGKTRTLPTLVPVRLDTARDVLGILRGQLDAVLGDQDLSTIETARAACLLCGTVLRAFEVCDVQERLDALEAEVQKRLRVA